MSNEGPLFTPCVPSDRLAVPYVEFSRHPGFRAGRRVMAEEFEFLKDVDGNFVEQFQTSAFDARTWELFLHAYVRDAGFVISRPRPAPDFLLQRDGFECAVEATTANAVPLATSQRPTAQSSPAAIQQYYVDFLLNAYPIRLGSPLYSKLRREYWNEPAVAGRPFLLGLGDLSEWGPGTGAALPMYLYGIHSYWGATEDGVVHIVVEDIERHRAGKKEIPSGFFRQEGSEHISAVMFSSTGTPSKFNRIGHQGAHREPAVTLLHTGLRYNHEDGARGPVAFIYDVGERRPQEPWGEGVSIYHNPFALLKLPLGVFPHAAEHQFVGGVLQSDMPAFHPLASKTIVVQEKGEERS